MHSVNVIECEGAPSVIVTWTAVTRASSRPAGTTSTRTIVDDYRRLHPGSERLYEEALRTFPSGVTHDIRYTTPFPIFVDHAHGSHKWDVDGNEYVDYVMGHGALFLGHAHPEITQAVI